MSSKLVMIGAFPPPVHGMSAVNASLRERLDRAGRGPLVIDISAYNLDRAMWARLARIPKVIKGLYRLLFMQKTRDIPLFLSVSGGLGQLYEIVFSFIARLRGMRLFLHHHSFSYLDKPNWITHLLTIAAGPKSLHIVLSRGMAIGLKNNYSSAQRVIPISNAVLLLPRATQGTATRTELKTIGFISNISAEKGIYEFLELAAACETEDLQIQASIAGPFQDAATARQVQRIVSTLSGVHYVGPKYGDDKEAFFDSIDLLVFPTKYGNEAEPVTIHEAMMRGLPVIAYGRGAIPEILSDDSGLIIQSETPFVPSALEKIKHWISSPTTFQTTSVAAIKRFQDTWEENSIRLCQIEVELLGTSSSLTPQMNVR